MDFTRLREYLDTLLKKYNVPGVDCMVYREHEPVFRYFTGMRDIENNKKTDGNELYLIFSMTKMITCTAALQLLEKGAYILNDPISMYLPEFEKMRISDVEFDAEASAKIISGHSIGEDGSKTAEGEIGYAKTPITVRHLFTMSAGLGYDLNDEEITAALKAGKTSTRDLVTAISRTVLGFEPGTRYRYSFCHDVLGALVEVLSGKSLGEYMQENIFEPLGMKNTFFGVPKDEERLSKMAARYTLDENGRLQRLPLECAYNLSDEYQSGGAGLTSSTEDYALFLDALACGGVGSNGNRILSSSTVELMSINQMKGRQVEDFYNVREGYGYGLGVRTHIDKTQSGSLSPLGEFGWCGAAGAFSMVDTQNKLSLTYFQSNHCWDKRMQAELRNALYSSLS